MTSETRANWIFLSIFLLIMGPGLAMLTAKACKRGAAGINPPAPKTVVAYNNSNPQNPALPRVLPPRTGEFADAIAYRISKLRPELKRVKAADGLPRMSERKAFELLAVGQSATHAHVALIGWDRTLAPLPSLYKLTASAGGATIDAKLDAYEQYNLPLEVRSELQKYGFLLPPDSVLWMIVEVPTSTPLESLSIHYQIDAKRLEDTVLLPSPATSQPAP